MKWLKYTALVILLLQPNIASANKIVPSLGPAPAPAPIPYKTEQVIPQPIIDPSLQKLVTNSDLIVVARYTGKEDKLPNQKSESGLFSKEIVYKFISSEAIKGTSPEELYVAPVYSVRANIKLQKGKRYLLFLRGVELSKDTKSEMSFNADFVYVLRNNSHALIQ